MCKTCSKCNITYEIPENDFYMVKNKHRYTVCKYCMRDSKRNYYSKPENKSKRKQHQDKYREKNHSVLLENARKAYLENKEKHKKRSAEYYDRYTKNNIQLRKDKNLRLKNLRILLTDFYVKALLKDSVFNIENPTDALIDIYRNVVLFKREQKQLTNLIKSLENGSITNL